MYSNFTRELIEAKNSEWKWESIAWEKKGRMPVNCFCCRGEGFWISYCGGFLMIPRVNFCEHCKGTGKI